MDGKITVGMSAVVVMVVVVVDVDSRKRALHSGISGKTGLGSGISGFALLEGVSIVSGPGILATLVLSSGISAAIESSSGKYGICHSLKPRHISKGLMMSISIGVTYDGVSQPALETYSNLSVQVSTAAEDAASTVLATRRLFLNMVSNCYL